MNRITIIACIVCLALGGAVGFWLGRMTLEQKWRYAVTIVSPEDQERASRKGADPTPKAGSKVLKQMPLARMRIALDDLSKKDPVKVTVGAFGRNDDATELHLAIENGGKCEVTSVEGVAYGFDAWGRPTPINVGGDHYIAFTQDKLKVAPGAKGEVSQELHNSSVANMALAQIDSYTCSDGTTWKR